MVVTRLGALARVVLCHGRERRGGSPLPVAAVDVHCSEHIARAVAAQLQAHVEGLEWEVVDHE